jgi:hypothetical protein
MYTEIIIEIMACILVPVIYAVVLLWSTDKIDEENRK